MRLLDEMRFSPIQSVITPSLEKMFCHKQQIHDGIKLCNHKNLGQLFVSYRCVSLFTYTNNKQTLYSVCRETPLIVFNPYPTCFGPARPLLWGVH